MTRLVARVPLVVVCAWVALTVSPGAQQAPGPSAGRPGRTRAAAGAPAPQPAPDAVAQLLQKIEQAIRSGDTAGYEALLFPGTNGAPFVQAMMRSGVTRAVVRERDRAPLPGARPDQGYRLAIDVFCEVGRRARLSTWRLDVVRRISAGGASADQWAIRDHELISSFAALYNLQLGPREYAARNLVLTAQDIELRLPEGAVFVAETEDGPTVLVLLGRGQMVFKPTPATEREQVRIFCGAESLDTGFSAAFVRVSPYALQRYLASGTMVERPPDADRARTAASIFRLDNGKSYAINLGDLTSDTWSLVPGDDDMLAELHTKRFGILTYTRSAHETEDVSLFDRAGRRNISIYASPEKLARRGFFYDDGDGQDYEILHYDVTASLDPLHEGLTGTGRLTVKVRAKSVNALSLKLAESLTIDSVVSREFGRVVAVRVVNQNSFLVYLPKSATEGSVLGLTVAYHGRIAPQMIDREAVSVGQTHEQEEDVSEAIRIEPSYLYSNSSYWYPQGESSSFATATLNVTVPANYACVASGDPDLATADAMARSSFSGTVYVFRALQPVRYLSVLVTRLLPVRAQIVDGGIDAADAGRDLVMRDGVFYRDVDLRAFASPRMRSRAVALSDRAGDVIHFYGSLVGDCPYPTLTLALVERELPGGHSPAYLAVVSQPILSGRLDWHNDPTSFAQFPEFFIAHELAHQWWGQAVGWKNYHERWLSEGLAQYFAALYAEQLRGKPVFDGMIRQMQRWAVRKSGEGPVYLGNRIGQVKRDPQLLRAIVYDKSAVVLHMLRRLIGDEAFFRGLRRFYQEWRFRKAGSDDLRRAFEQESHVPLGRFFERWIYDSRLPRVRFSWRTESSTAGGTTTLVLRFDQTGDIFDFPVTATIEYADRPARDVLVAVTDAVTEVRVPLEGKLRGVEVNRDQMTVAQIEK